MLRRSTAFTSAVTAALAAGDRLAGRDALRRHAHRVLDTLGVRLETPPVPAPPTDATGAAGLPGTLVVANHISWLDVVALLAYNPVPVLAKREVGTWPVIGPLARRAGALFIDRDSPRELPRAVAELATMLRAGRSVLVFPQGTTWCTAPGGAFRRATFQAALEAGAPVRPVAVHYRQHGVRTPLPAYVGDGSFVASLGRVARADGLTAHLTACPPIEPAQHDRRSLAAAAEAAVRAALPDPAPQPDRAPRPRPAPQPVHRRTPPRRPLRQDSHVRADTVPTGA